MEQKQKPGRKEPRGQKSSDRGSASDVVFDSWLETKLKSAYSSVLDEPIPEDLIQLLIQKLKD